MTTIQEAKNLNKMSLESLISNLQRHEMEFIGGELVKKLNSLALKSFDHSAKFYQDWKSEEPTHEGFFEEDLKDKEMTFIIKRFQYLANKKNIRLLSIGNGFIRTSSRVEKYDQKGCYICKKLGHFIVEFQSYKRTSQRK